MPAQISPLWATPLWIGAVPRHTISQLAAIAGPDPVDLATTVPELETIAELERAASQVEPGATGLIWTHQLVCWPPGFHVGMRYTSATIRACVIIMSGGTAEIGGSGSIDLHDPRAGISNVGLPGLPWGRPVRIPRNDGVAFAHPGWVAYSVAPLRQPHSVTVWIAEAHGPS